jgi:acylphosphatase
MARQQTEGWFRSLDNGRLEIFLKTEGEDATFKVRASGPEADMYELVEWFEQKTGLTVEGHWRRVRKGPKPLEGQTSMMVPELQSDPGSDDG